MSALPKTNATALPYGSVDVTDRAPTRYVMRREVAYAGSVDPVTLPVYGTAEITDFAPAEVQPALAESAVRNAAIRVLDVLGALAGLLLASPILLVLALLIRRDGGKALFSQIRVGKEGVGFQCYKMRSMASDAEARLSSLLEADPQAAAEWAEHRKLRNDPRITPLGHFIRKTSLDELPQLWNVLKGDMSLVGPRPIVPDELAMYGKDAAAYMAQRPGLTGLWQVSGRSDCDYETRVALDIEWNNRRTVLSYLEIIFKTVPAVLAKDGAY